MIQIKDRLTSYKDKRFPYALMQAATMQTAQVKEKLHAVWQYPKLALSTRMNFIAILFQFILLDGANEGYCPL